MIAEGDGEIGKHIFVIRRFFLRCFYYFLSVYSLELYYFMQYILLFDSESLLLGVPHSPLKQSTWAGRFQKERSVLHIEKTLPRFMVASSTDCSVNAKHSVKILLFIRYAYSWFNAKRFHLSHSKLTKPIFFLSFFNCNLFVCKIDKVNKVFSFFIPTLLPMSLFGFWRVFDTHKT